MNSSDVRKRLVKVFIGSLSLTAAFAILPDLGGPSGSGQLRMLSTAFSISAASLCAMACVALIERRKGMEALAILGIVAAAVAATLVVIGVWGAMIDHPGYWRTTSSFIVLSIACAHACLLLLPNLAADHRWIQTAWVVVTAFLAARIILVIWNGINHLGDYGFMVVGSILVVLATFIIPILGWFNAKTDKAPVAQPHIGKEPEPAQELVLRRVAGGVFTDQAGRWYQVTPTKPGGLPNAGPLQPHDDAPPVSVPSLSTAEH